MNRQARTAFAVRKLAKALQGTVPDTGFTFVIGTVKTVTAAGATDGNAMLEVTVNGTDTLAPYLASYATPTVGHVVRVDFLNGSPMVVGRVIGFPVF